MSDLLNEIKLIYFRDENAECLENRVTGEKEKIR